MARRAPLARAGKFERPLAQASSEGLAREGSSVNTNSAERLNGWMRMASGAYAPH